MQMLKQIQNKKGSHAGFTLTEMLVVLCLVAVLSGFFLQCFIFVMEQYQSRMALLELDDNLSIAMDYIAMDLADCIGVSGCSTDSLTILHPDGAIYYTTGTDPQEKAHFYDLKGKILYRRENTQRNRQPMANFVSRLCVNYYDRAGIRTADAASVYIIEVELEGIWNETTVKQRQIARIQDSRYY